MTHLWYYIKHLYLKFNKDDGFFLASGVAFSLLICIIPLILIVFSFVGFSLSSSAELWEKLVLYLKSLIPVSSESIISNTQALIRDRKLIGLIGLIAAAFTATRLFAAIRNDGARLLQRRDGGFAFLKVATGHGAPGRDAHKDTDRRQGRRDGFHARVHDTPR